MSTFAEYLARLRADAERRHADPFGPGSAWSAPGEWCDVAAMLAEIETTARQSRDLERVVMAAFLAGEAHERAILRANLSETLDVGYRVKAGGKRGASRAHGPAAARKAERQAWLRRYRELRDKFPTDPKKALLGIIEDETGTPARTLRRYIKDA